MLTAIVVVLAGQVAAVALPKPKGIEDGGLVGVWDMTELHRGDSRLTKDQIPGGKMCFTGKEYLAADNVQPIAGSYQVNAGKKPHTITFTAYNGDGKGRSETMLVDLEGDTLRITHRPGSLAQVAVFKRITGNPGDR